MTWSPPTPSRLGEGDRRPPSQRCACGGGGPCACTQRHAGIAADLEYGGWLFITLAPASDGAALLGVPDGLKVYAARIPPLRTPRSMFTPVIFPVRGVPPAGPYDDLFAEVDDYDDGFAKAVHCAQPQAARPTAGNPRRHTAGVRELGIRIGWDDEQVTIWLNRQIDPAAAALDAPMGVHGYRVDVREHGTAPWHSLTRASGPVTAVALDVGTFDGELAVETHPVQLHGTKTGDYWLPTYFAAWTGPSLVASTPTHPHRERAGHSATAA